MDEAGSECSRPHSNLDQKHEVEARKCDQTKEQSIGASEDVEANVIGLYRHTLSAKATNGHEPNKCRENDPIPSPEDAEDIFREGNTTHEEPEGLYLNSPGGKSTSDTDGTETRTLHDHHNGKEIETKGTQSEPVSGGSTIVKTLKTDKKRLLRKIRGHKEDIRGLKAENEDLEQQIEDLKEERGEREARFQEAQEDALALLRKDANSDSLPDDKIQIEFKSIFAMCRRMGKKYAELNAESWKVKKEIEFMLTGPNGNQNIASAYGLDAVFDGRISARQVLTATLCHHVAGQVFADPFFYLRDYQPWGHRTDLRELLLTVQELGADSGEKMQHQWRAMTVRMIDSVRDNAAAAETRGQARIRMLKENAYASSADNFLRCSHMLLRGVNPGEANTRRDELSALFERAGNLACQLHGQHVYIKVLSSHNDVEAFSVDDTTMEAHTTMDIEQSDHSWDGKPIDIVLQPGLIAFGNERAENYEAFKVWSKAVVWMSKKRAKTKVTAFPTERTKSPGNSINAAKPRSSKVAIMIPDDGDGQPAKSVLRDDGVTHGGEIDNQQRGENIKDQVRPASTEADNKKKQPSSQISYSVLEKGLWKSKSLLIESVDDKPSDQRKGSETMSKQTQVSPTGFQFRIEDPAKETAKTHTKKSVKNAGSSKKRNRSGEEHSTGAEPPRKKGGENDGEEHRL